MSFFVGIAFEEQIRAEIARACTAPNIKWERPEKLHLTLFFYGARAPDDCLKPAARHAPFTLQLKSSGTFDDRILWLAVTGQLDELHALQADFGKEERPYVPHVTLARAKRGRIPQLLSDFEGTPFTVRELTLFESRNGNYSVVLTAPLGASPPDTTPASG